MSKTSYFTKVDGKKVTSVENIVKRHGGEYCRFEGIETHLTICIYSFLSTLEVLANLGTDDELSQQSSVLKMRRNELSSACSFLEM